MIILSLMSNTTAPSQIAQIAHASASAIARHSIGGISRQSSEESESWSKGPHWSRFNGPVATDEAGHPLGHGSLDLPRGSVRPIRTASESGTCALFGTIAVIHN